MEVASNDLPEGLMQLFVAAYGLEGDSEGRLRRAVDSGAQAFPSFSAEPTFSATAGRRLSVAAKSHSPEVAAPRNYRAQRGAELVLFDGLPIGRDPSVLGYDAEQLLAGWSAIRESLTGIYSAIHVDLEQEAVECVIDPLGLCQVFAWEDAGRWVIGNNVDVIRQLIPDEKPDPLGVGSLLTLGWPIDGRTLIDGLKVLPGGYLHRWAGGSRTSRGWCTPELLAPGRLQVAPPSADSVADELKKTVNAAAQCGPVRCGVTAGRDSRVVLSLLRAAEIHGSCYTVGQEGHPDVEAGKNLSSIAGCEHHAWEPELPQNGDWPNLTSQFVSQTNGLANVAAIADWVDNQREDDPIAVKLWGIGGEIGRGAIGLSTAMACNAPFLRSSLATQQRVLTKSISAADGLFSDECVAVTRDALHRFIDVRRGEGWRTSEVLEAAYAFERVSHWAAAGVRRASATTDVFSPFATTDFLRFSFAMGSGGRYVENPHRLLLDELDPELRRVPFNRPWRPQHPRLAPLLVSVEATRGAARRRSAAKRGALANRRSVTGPGLTISGRWFDQFGHAWFEAGEAYVRDAMLSRPESPVWDYVNRRKLEKLLTAAPDGRRSSREALCRLLTVFWHLHPAP